jgi:putative heme-binding domain-containing protein
MGVTLQMGPGGEVYVSDWSDTGECHSVTNTQRQTGRIYRVAYGQLSRPRVNLAQLSNQELVELQLHANDWYVRHARRLLLERTAAGQDMSAVHEGLRAMFAQQTDVPRKLRALWALWVTGGLPDEALIDLLGNDDEYLRAWAIRLLCEDHDPPEPALREFERLASEGNSSLVRLHLASVLQRLAPQRRWSIAAALAGHSQDASDANLPLMLWYAVEPLVNADVERFVALAAAARVPGLRQHMARRVASLNDSGVGVHAIVQKLVRLDDAEVQCDLLLGTLKGLEGRRTMSQPDGWSAAFGQLAHSARPDVREATIRLALVFDDPLALQTLSERAADSSLPSAERNQSIEALIGRRPDTLAPLLIKLVDDSAVQQVALRGLAHFNHPDTANEILARYQSFDRESRQQALQTLASRVEWATQLLDAVQSRTIDYRELTAYTVRQIQSLGDADLIRRINELWGEVRATSADRQRHLQRLRRQLTADVLSQADLAAGRAIFQKQCATCHRFFTEGGTIGPDITGMPRTNIDYLLENIIDPSAVVSRDYRMQVIETNDGRVVTGLVEGESDQAVTLLTVNERIIVPTTEIENRTESNVSMMPDGLLNPMTSEEIRDLIGYVSGNTVGPGLH